MNTDKDLNIVTEASSTDTALLKHTVKGKLFPDEENTKKPSGGRNAYDIREAILEQAIDIVKASNIKCSTLTDVDLLVGKFYGLLPNSTNL